MLAVLDIGRLDLLGRAVALRHLHAVRNAAHVELRHRRAFSRMDVLGEKDDIELAVLVDDIAFAKRTGDDLHGRTFLKRAIGDFGSNEPFDAAYRIFQAAASPGTSPTPPSPRPDGERVRVRGSADAQLTRRHMTNASPWWAPHRHADRRPRLLQRNAIAAAIRDWFARRDFVEVETAALQVSPGNETHLSAFATEAILPDASRAPLYLHTSPEFACKKLLAAGEAKDLQLRPGLSQPRARSAAPSRIHHARMVPRRRDL